MTKPVPVITGKEPIAAEVEKDKLYSWCTCGLSKKASFCDGAHKAEDKFKPFRWVADEAGTKYFCNCKQTKAQPFCDGSHKEM